MSKVKVALPAPRKYRKFGQVNRAVFAVALAAVENPGQWVRVKGMKQHRVYAVSKGGPLAFAPAGAYRGRWHHGKAEVKFVGTLGTSLDYPGLDMVISPDGKSGARHPRHADEIVEETARFVRGSLERD